MEPIIWGPTLWFFIHTLSFYYPDKPSFKDKTSYYDFFHNLQNILPCPDCKANYIKHLNQYPITPYLDSKKSLVQWVVNMHNLVNKENNKPTWETSDVIDLYKKIYQDKKPFCYYFQREQIEQEEKKESEQKIKEKLKKKRKFKIKIIICSIIIILFIFVILYLIFIFKKKINTLNNPNNILIEKLLI